MPTLYAQPYDMDHTGFYFKSYEDYKTKSEKSLAEEFEIQFIDGDDDFDYEISEAMGLYQSNIEIYFQNLEDWDDETKLHYVLAVGYDGYDPETDPTQLDITVYHNMTMNDLAQEFVDEGLFGEIPEPLQYYINYEAIAADLAMDYSDAVINGTCYVWRTS